MPSATSPPPQPPRLAFAVLLAGALVYVAVHALGDAGADLRNWISPLVYLGVAGVIALRAVRVREDRAAWALFAAGAASYALGSLLYAAFGRPGATAVPWPAHAAWLGLYAAAFSGVVLLLRTRMPRLAATLALDGLVGALALATVTSAFLLGVADAVDGVGREDALLGIVYAGADLLLLALVLWAAWLGGRSGARMWLTLAAGVGLVLTADVIVDLDAVTGGFEEASVLRGLYPFGLIVVAAAAWQPPAHGRAPRIDSLAVIAVPGACVAIALVMLALDHTLALPEATHVLAVALLALAFLRAGLTYRELRRLKEGRRFLRGFEDAAIGMALTTPEGRWLRVNAAFGAMVGRRPEDLVGRTVEEVIHPDERGATAQRRAAAVGGTPQSHFTRRMVHSDGTTIETLCSTVHVADDGERPYLFSQIQDVTERNRATRHSAALAELGRLAIEVHERDVLVDRAMPVVAEALGADRCAVLPAADAPAGGELRVPLRRRPGADEHVLVAWRPGRAADADRRFVQAVADVLTGALDRADAEAETLRRSLHDPLTGLANRTFLAAHVEQELASAPAPDGALALLLLDVDRFKMVNDTLGHTAGDELLCEVAARLRAETRRGDLVARLGGDEFVIACHSGTDAAAGLADRIVAAFGRPFVVAGREVVLGASVGLAASDERARTAEQLLRNADIAMYRAKDQGGARSVAFDADLEAGVVERLTLEAELRHALERGQLLLHYQPVFGLDDGTLRGFEALLRWQHPEHGLVPPDRFVPIAEDTGLIEPIGAWVIDETCRTLAAWNRDRAGRPLQNSVNLSVAQLRPELVDLVAAALDRHGVPPGLLILEITESLMVEGEGAIEVVDALRALGVRIALDDFGVGYSSLGFISDLALDFVKLDRSLVAGLGTSPRALGLVKGVVEMAQALGLQVLAEGVEEERQVLTAREVGCTFAQGWYYARALPAAEAAALALAPTPVG